MSDNPFANPYRAPQPFASDPVPFAPVQKPAVWFWYIGYCMAMAGIYLLLVAAAVVMLVGAKQFAEKEGEEFVYILMGIVYGIMGGAFFLLYAAVPFLPQTKLAWIYGFVVICIGFTSCCTLPFSIALLIQWVRPEVKSYLNVR